MTEQEGNAEEVEGKLPEMEAEQTADAASENDAVEAMREKWLRAQADIQNMRKRSAAQTQAAIHRERTEMLLSFLGVLDSLEAALTKHEGEHNDWAEGTEAIFRQMIKIFKDYNVEPFTALDQPFDPNLHEAMGQVPVPGKPANTVVEVLQPGFRFTDGTLLRPARVIVSAEPKE